MLITFNFFISFIDYIVPGNPSDPNNIPIHLSMFHTVFNIINVALLIWFVPQIASIVRKMVKPSREEESEEEYKLEYFSTGVQPIPEIAIIEAKKEVIKMSALMTKMLILFHKTFKSEKDISSSLDKARKMELKSDQMQEEISVYLAECTKHELSFESSKGAAAMMRIVNELESVGDSTLNLFLQIDRLKDDSKLSNAIKAEVSEMYNVVMKFIEWNNSFILNDIASISQKDLDKSIKYERTIDDFRNRLIDSSRQRLSEGSSPKVELLFMDIIKHLEHIGDYSLNISQALEQTND